MPCNGEEAKQQHFYNVIAKSQSLTSLMKHVTYSYATIEKWLKVECLVALMSSFPTHEEHLKLLE